MGTYNTTEDIEFLTDVDTDGNIVRRGRFVSRPRRIGPRVVPGNARYYRNRQRDLLAGRRAAQRGTRAGGGARRAAGTAATGAARPATSTAPRRPAAPAGGQRRGGILSRIRRAARNAARGVESRARTRRESRNRR
jgi:hypothetical protein